MKKILLICISMLGLSACNEGVEKTEVTNKQAFYGLEIYAGGNINVKMYRIDNGTLSGQSPIPSANTYYSEINKYYFSDQGVPTLKQITNQNFIWGRQAFLTETTTQVILKFKPENMRENENLAVEYHFDKIDLTGLSFASYAENLFYYGLYKSSGDGSSPWSASNQILYATAFSHFEDKFPIGSTCWKLKEIQSNKDYIAFESTSTRNFTVDAATLLENQGVWNGTAWQVIDTTSFLNTFFKIGNQQYLGRYITQKDVIPDIVGEFQCDYFNETATKALLTKYKQIKL